MRRLLLAMIAGEVALLIVAAGAGLTASSGWAGSGSYGVHRTCGLAMASLAWLMPGVAWLEAGVSGRRVRESWGGVAPDWAEAQLERFRRRILPLVAGSIVLATATVLLGWLAEAREWSSAWHLAASMALASYTIGGAWLVAANVAAESKLERLATGRAGAN